MIIKKPKINLKSIFPPVVWFRQYNTENAVCDFIAGITVGLTLIPQSIAYAALAGLGPEYGLYSSLCGGVIYAVFGTIPQLNIAPTALLSLLTFTYTNGAPFGAANAAVLLCFFAGLIELVCGILHLGFLVDFVSVPVVAGFTSAGAITIASAQVKNLMGLSFNGETFIEIWKNVFEHISEAKLWDGVLSIVCCSVLLLLRQIKDYGTPPVSESKEGSRDLKSILKTFVWFLSVSRNAVVVLLCAVMAYTFSLHESKPFSLTSKVSSGLPQLTPPPFTVVSNNNETYTITDMAKYLGSGIFVTPFIAILSNIAIAKAFAQGKVVDATQEMLAVGFCSLFGSFLSSMPVNASFSRAAVSNASGTRTPFAGIYTSIMVVLSMTFLTPYFTYIPKATLASVIICAVIFMVEVSIVKPLWKINKIDMIPLVVTLVACLIIGIEKGILAGVVVDALFLLYYSARPRVEIEEVMNDSHNYLKIMPDSAVFFPAIENLREKIVQTTNNKTDKFQTVVIDCVHISRVDYTSAKGVASLCNDLEKNGKSLVIVNAVVDVERVLSGACSDKCIFAKTDQDLIQSLKDFPFRAGSVATVHFDYISDEWYKDSEKGTNL
ncbi:sodium-independent sulfate anion transporter [Agrilus planipennis]|uniref:Sodium-independent sulfate anion transporter n=1 Tax=Agrilus planipennis TaxID=224129 RepID=A0A1W4XDG5_AGRPL|nr:sodium-independent sulfate anion transporter [Agrilus planipennis]XP_025832335.1 sodium-independent sulfate anion transporter [Agrilus planipennis]XP_025832336.1 sodium-independent sulfate anion transporter [Agrilus planipennis]